MLREKNRGVRYGFTGNVRVYKLGPDANEVNLGTSHGQTRLVRRKLEGHVPAEAG